ncbi:MAG: hypothetical protein H7A53_06820 [Akkermansiaceae bacterium]|nr:hypothetical protein [Akkermansiaceae bacterium]MCP5550584.1 hypothetical protein [Akkermansiaceae bacterium]
MKKFIMALSILAMGGGAFLGVVNQGELKDERQILADVREEVTKLKTDVNQAESDVAEAREQKTAAEDARNQASAAVSEQNQQIKRQEAQIATSQDEIGQIDIQKKEIDLAIKEVDPDGELLGKGIDQVQVKMQMLRDNLTEIDNKKVEHAAQLETVKGQVAVAQDKVRELESYQIERAKTIALNGLEATVIAVNRQWGFVLVNAGKNLGVSPESSLLVKRGQDRIGRLRIVSLEPNMVVADVIPDSVAQGVRVMAGDKVIFENTK